jgi:ribonuclease D
MSSLFSNSISKEEVTALPKVEFNGKIVVVSSEEEFEHWLPQLISQKILGFDTETKPTFRKGELNSIALLQLSNSNLALLIRLMHTGIPKPLLNFLQDPKILKIGAAIRDDLKSLQKIKKFTPEGFIDLQSIVPQYGIEELSVRKMAAIVLGKKVSKSQQLSNWNAPTLSEAQQHYAAIDAWVCREIYVKLITSKIRK